ncbi:MAG: hypothetical protein ACT4QF_05620 [Sporichthyaceae bacterium]
MNSRTRTKATAGKAAGVALVAVAAVLPGTAAVAVADHHQGGGKRGAMVVCNHGGYGFGVYADGPDSFSDDLAGSFDECADWSPARTGQYEVGFSFPYATPPGTLFEVRIKRNGHTTYRTFNDEGSFSTNVGKNQTTRIDFYVK